MSMPPRRSSVPILGAALALLFLAPLVGPLAPSQAGDADEKPHLQFRPTYHDALLEARIRNLPVFISRHKDY